MDIHRIGSGHRREKMSINLDGFEIRWCYQDDYIVLFRKCVNDFYETSHHDYEVCITLEEISRIIAFIGGDIFERKPSVIEKSMSGETNSMIRMLAAGAGLHTIEENGGYESYAGGKKLSIDVSKVLNRTPNKSN